MMEPFKVVILIAAVTVSVRCQDTKAGEGVLTQKQLENVDERITAQFEGLLRNEVPSQVDKTIKEQSYENGKCLQQQEDYYYDASLTRCEPCPLKCPQNDLTCLDKCFFKQKLIRLEQEFADYRKKLNEEIAKLSGTWNHLLIATFVISLVCLLACVGFLLYGPKYVSDYMKKNSNSKSVTCTSDVDDVEKQNLAQTNA